MENKNIDRLFQEQLKNLETTPNKKVWNNIASKLKKKKRKVLPFWWFSGGIAAILMLGLLLFPFSKEINQTEKNPKNRIITSSPEEKIDFKNNSKKEIDTLILNQKTLKETLVAKEETTTKNQNKTYKNKSLKTESKKELVSTKNAMKKIFLADNSTEVHLDSTKKESLTIIESIAKNNSNTAVVFKENKELDKKVISKKTDLNDFIKKKDSIKEKKSIQKQWTVAPIFAVLNSNSFTNTSPIDKNLSNSTEGKNTYSYGVQVAYKINNKWTLQSGVNLQEMSYTNSQVIVVSAVARNSSSVAFSDGNTFSFNKNTSENFDSALNPLTNTVSSNGSLSQKYGYIEIPIEIKYNFSNNKKFETQLVAGFSSLFLNKNEINLNTNVFSKSGKANNLNNVNFSGNLGFDFNYFINSNWSLNLNPMIKTQLNTFSSNSNGFSPFNIGIYTGIKYTF